MGVPVVTMDGSIDTSGSRINTSGFRINTSGSRINTSGSRIDTSGLRIDTSGSRIDTSGIRIDTSGIRIDPFWAGISKTGFWRRGDSRRVWAYSLWLFANCISIKTACGRGLWPRV
ncbi:MAG: hypothetical protein LBI58_06275 [Tannerellaceae bacterium]|jgi:hypothetical protein|nr:hypothetical protein [Tannerellaceae bacterium]